MPAAVGDQGAGQAVEAVGEAAMDRVEAERRGAPRAARPASRSGGWRGCGSRWRSRRLRNAPMWRIAQSPRNGIEPWATRPKVSTSAHQTPRWPMQMRSTPSGSGMITWSTRGRENQPWPASQATPAWPPNSSSTVPDSSSAPGKPDALREDALERDHRGRDAAFHVAGAAAVQEALADHAGERVDAPAVARLDDVEMAVEMDAGAGAAAFVAADHVDPRMALAVAERALGAHGRGPRSRRGRGGCRAAARRPCRRRPAG